MVNGLGTMPVWCRGLLHVPYHKVHGEYIFISYIHTTVFINHVRQSCFDTFDTLGSSVTSPIM